MEKLKYHIKQSMRIVIGGEISVLELTRKEGLVTLVCLLGCIHIIGLIQYIK